MCSCIWSAKDYDICGNKVQLEVTREVIQAKLQAYIRAIFSAVRLRRHQVESPRSPHATPQRHYLCFVTAIYEYSYEAIPRL